MEIECPRCGEIWAVKPRKWRNYNSVLRDGKKKIHCPFCNKLIILSRETTKKLLDKVVPVSGKIRTLRH